MIEFFVPSLRLLRSMASAWRKDPQFRSLLVLAGITLFGGPVFYSAVEGWSVGLGDLSPQATVGRIFTVIYIFAGLSIILGFIDAVSEETLGRRRRRRQRRQSSDVGQDDEDVSGS
jgi:voltage-gated potassium channel